MGGICYGRRLSLGDSHGSAWLRAKVNLDNADLKTWQILATNSSEMSLNQQLQPATEYEVRYPQKITICMALAGLECAMSCIEQELMHMHKDDYNELGP